MYTRTIQCISAIAAVCLLGLLLLACGSPAQQPTVEPTPTPAAKTPAPVLEEMPPPEAPDFTLEARDGTMLTLSELRGKPVFLNLFATWCGPCVREMPTIQAVYEEYGDRVHFLAMNLGEDKAKVDAFLDEYGFTFPVVYDYDGTVSGASAGIPIPQTFMLDENGMILDIIDGAMDAEAMTALIKNALGS